MSIRNALRAVDSFYTRWLFVPFVTIVFILLVPVIWDILRAESKSLATLTAFVFLVAWVQSIDISAQAWSEHAHRNPRRKSYRRKG